jgi:hypothetical protein
MGTKSPEEKLFNLLSPNGKNVTVYIRDEKDLNDFRDYALKNIGLDFKRDYLSNYFIALEYQKTGEINANGKSYVNTEYIYDGGYSLPFYVVIRKSIFSFYIDHLGWEGLKDEKEKERISKEYSHFKQDAKPLEAYLNPEKYPEYWV